MDLAYGRALKDWAALVRLAIRRVLGWRFGLMMGIAVGGFTAITSVLDPDGSQVPAMPATTAL